MLCTGYLGESVSAAFGDSYGSIRLFYSREPSPLGTAGALRLALPLFKSHCVLVMNGDSFCKVDLNRFWRWHRAGRARATLVVVKVVDTRAYGRVHLGSDRTIVSFGEKSGDNRPGWINAGIYLLDRRLVQSIPVNRAVSLEREMIPCWIGRGLYGYQSKGPFLDIGTPEAYATGEYFFSHKLKQ